MYLNMDGVDDEIIVSGFKFNKIEMSMQIMGPPTGFIYFHTGFSVQIANSVYLRYNPSSTLTGKINGVDFPYNSSLIPHLGVPIVFEMESINEIDGNATSGNRLFGGTPAYVYYVKFYNGETLVAHYDMNEGNLNDQSGNGNHSTLIGGTWEGEAVEPEYPEVEIVNINRRKLSSNDGMGLSTATFKFNKDVTEYVLKVEGTSYETGDTAHVHLGNVAAGQEAVGLVSWDELRKEGNNRINIYGKDTEGNWTPYTP